MKLKLTNSVQFRHHPADDCSCFVCRRHATLAVYLLQNTCCKWQCEYV